MNNQSVWNKQFSSVTSYHVLQWKTRDQSKEVCYSWRWIWVFWFLFMERPVLFPRWNVVSCFETVETNYLKLYKNVIMCKRFTNPIPHSFVTLSSTTKLRLGLPNKVMSTCELSKLGLDETRKGEWAQVSFEVFSSSLVRVLWVRLKWNKPGNRVIVSSMGCFIVQLNNQGHQFHISVSLEENFCPLFSSWIFSLQL